MAIQAMLRMEMLPETLHSKP